MDEKRIYEEMHKLEELIDYKFKDIQKLADAMNAAKIKDPKTEENTKECTNHALATVGDAIRELS